VRDKLQVALAMPVLRLALTAPALLLVLLFATTAEAGPCRGGEEAITVEVKSGDSFSRIAARHDVGSKIVERSNPGVDPRSIRPGQKLKVCVPKSSSSASGSKSAASKKKKKKRVSCGGGRYLVTHEVEKGDTISKIARDYGSGEASIYRRNPALDDDPTKLRIGQSLKICSGAGVTSSGKSAKKSKLCGYRSPLWTHEVVPGEMAAAIAARYGVRRSDLYKLNSSLRANPNLIRPGQKVRVCPEIAPRERSKATHTVKSGENVQKIAKKYGLTSRELIAYQRGKLSDPSSLRVGQKLVVYKDGGLVAGFGALDDDSGTLKGGTNLRAGSYYTTKAASLSWGTAKTVRLIQTAIANYRKRSKGGPKVHVGDISRRGGGRFPPHKSHQHGRDVDIGFVHKGATKDTIRFVDANASNLDVMRSYRLIKAFIDTNEVRYVFVDYGVQKLLYEYAKGKGVSDDTLSELFQYPRGRRAGRGIIRHEKGHDDHFHVRFRR
jgi:LysM repeat protein